MIAAADAAQTEGHQASVRGPQACRSGVAPAISSAAPRAREHWAWRRSPISLPNGSSGAERTTAGPKRIRACTDMSTAHAANIPEETPERGSSPPMSAWERFSLEVMRQVLYALARTCTLSGLYHIGRAFATLEWIVDYRRRRRVNRQMEIVLGDQSTNRQRRHATWRHFVRVRNDKMLFLIFDLLPPRSLLKRFEVTNRHLLDHALARGRGMYMALSHLGSHHLVISILMQQGYDRIAGVRDAKMGAVWRFIQHKHEQKRRTKVEYFFSDAFPRSIYQRFQDNYVVGSLIDVQSDRGGHLRTLEADIFGHRRSFLTGPLRIAMRCGAPVAQVFVVSRPYFRYEVEFHGPLLDPAREQETPDTLARAVQSYAANVERFARRRPCHISRY